MPRGFPNCACEKTCGDVPEDQDKPRAVCKGLGYSQWVPPEPKPVTSSRKERAGA